MKKTKTFAKKQITMLTLVLALAVAVYLNWQLAGNDKLMLTDVIATPSASEATTFVEEEQVSESGEIVDDAAKTEYYGEALFVSAKEDGQKDEYFAKARLTRTSTRDEALDTLQKSLQKTELTESEKNKLTEQLTKIATDITKEGTIESVVKAKGFSECVAFINGENVKVVVKANAGGLTVAEVSQIKEIVLSECGASASNISIVEIE